MYQHGTFFFYSGCFEHFDDVIYPCLLRGIKSETKVEIKPCVCFSWALTFRRVLPLCKLPQWMERWWVWRKILMTPHFGITHERLYLREPHVLHESQLVLGCFSTFHAGEREMCLYMCMCMYINHRRDDKAAGALLLLDECVRVSCAKWQKHWQETKLSTHPQNSNTSTNTAATRKTNAKPCE